ncbi:MAG: SulP family inorganic anion transporter, partial [Flavobacteriales bacterium]|nr:SulP family inorganic anion transporter [Flavobacteriales bacterium]
VGISTAISGAIGGLPVITVIVRSTVNVYNNAKTGWSNFYHGALLAIFVLLLTPVIQIVPLAALAAILVVTGYKLASPRVFKDAYSQGIEQLLFLVTTLVITLLSNLLWGIVGGIAITLVVHILLSRLPIHTFFNMVFQSRSNVFERKDGTYELQIKGIANFLSMVQLNKLLELIPREAMVKVNFTKARLVDLTYLENINEFKRAQEARGGKVVIAGLEEHVASTAHPLALKSLNSRLPIRLTARQQRLRNLAVNNGWTFDPEMDWEVASLKRFQFFETRPIEYRENIIEGHYADIGLNWEICDITFDEGALEATEVYHTTVQVIHLTKEIPRFILDHEGIFDKVFKRMLAISGRKTIDLKEYPEFSRRFILKGSNEDEIREFFTADLISILSKGEVYHIESNGNALLLFRHLRTAKAANIRQMVSFSRELIPHIES